MQHIDIVQIELSKLDVNKLQIFAESQAKCGDVWGQFWAGVAEAARQAQLRQAVAQHEREHAYGQSG